MSGQNFKEGINLELTPEQELVRTTAREFVDNEIIPNIAELDREHVLSFDIIRGMADLGMLGAPIPEEYGGAIAALADAAPGVAMATLIPGGSRRIITVCLLYTSDAADDLLCVDLGGRRIIKKKKKKKKR